jgi:hypothetical protein
VTQADALGLKLTCSHCHHHDHHPQFQLDNQILKEMKGWLLMLVDYFVEGLVELGESDVVVVVLYKFFLPC